MMHSFINLFTFMSLFKCVAFLLQMSKFYNQKGSAYQRSIAAIKLNIVQYRYSLRCLQMVGHDTFNFFIN